MRNNIKKYIMLGAMVLTLTVPQVVGATGFTDVEQSKWYYNDIKKVKELGIIDGYEDNSYKPSNTITRVEALKVVVESKTGGQIDAVSGGKWYTKYINYGIKKDIKIDDINKPITRAEIAEYIVKVYEKETRETEGLLHDTKDINIERLYRDSIMQGVGEENGKAVVNPDANLTRAEMAALINRVLGTNVTETQELVETGVEQEEEEVEIEVEEEEVEIEEGMRVTEAREMYRELKANKVDEPRTEKEFIAEFYDMLSYGDLERVILYKNNTRENSMDPQTITDAYTKAYGLYPEYLSYANRIQIGRGYTEEGEHIKITLSLYNEEKDTTSVWEKVSIFEEKAGEVVTNLIEAGKITQEQTELEKARELYKWVIQNTDYHLRNVNDVHTGYEQLKSGRVVCQGYVSTYNYLLRLVGIQDVVGVTGTVRGGGNHIWTEAVLDGRTVLIDPTFGDPVGEGTGGNYVDYKYFDIPRSELRSTHTWK